MLHAACDFFVMPSQAEAFGMMAIEAMACARPVLSVVERAPGVTFAPEAAHSSERCRRRALAGAIDHLARNPAICEQRGKRSRELAERHYDIREQARLTANLYHRTLERFGSIK